jgi:hypothetical protein
MNSLSQDFERAIRRETPGLLDYTGEAAGDRGYKSVLTLGDRRRDPEDDGDESVRLLANED